MPVSDQGASTSRYALIPRTLSFITRGSSVLLLKGAAHKRLWAGKYNGVGGHVERNEDVLSSARREVFEETGLNVPDLHLCGVITIDAGPEVGIGIYILRGEWAGGDLISSSEGDPEWVPFDQLGHIPLVEDLPILLPRVLALPAGSPPLSAHYHYDENDRLVISFSNPEN